MKVFKITIIFFFLSILVEQPSYAQNNQITIAVAANVQYAIKDLKTEFNKESGIGTKIIIGSSGQLTAQINQGAPYDVFISADMMYPNTLYKDNMAVNKPRVYAYGSLVLWTMKKGIHFRKNFAELLNDHIQKIALANPRTAPYGVATVEALKYFKIYNKVKSKLIYGESIAPTNQYIISGAADIGFTAKSVVMSPVMKGKGHWTGINPSAYQPIKQGCVILTYGYRNHRKASETFYHFMFSKKARLILKKFGYETSSQNNNVIIGLNHH